MAQFLVRNVSEATAVALRQRAARNGRSVEAEHRALLDAAARPTQAEDARWAQIDQLRERTHGRIVGDSTNLIREDRDSR